MQRRYHGLDALRAFAMLLGIVLHACQFYLTPSWLPALAPWVSVPAPPATDGTGFLAITIHIWRMPVFFLLAGFFAQMTLERKGLRYFWLDRFFRLFVTLWVFHAVFVIVLGRPLWGLAHLWFLWVLSFCCLIAPLSGRIVTGWIFGTPAQALLCTLPVALAGLLNRNNIWHDIPGRPWDLEWSAFLLYGSFFVLGQALWKARSFVDRMAHPIIFGTLLTAAFAITSALGIYYHAPIPEIVRQVLIACATLGWAFGLIGLAERVIRRNTPILTLGVEMSYAVYLFHLYIAFYLSAWTIQLGWAQHFAIPAVTVAAFTLSATLYFLLVRYTPLDVLLAGPQKARFMRWLKPVD